ncbi:MAG TPA: DUF2948 family protein [Alphaproteobacteria bacterium]|nr:DUF2948 family protein [Alphaproteobacteria bacterium]
MSQQQLRLRAEDEEDLRIIAAVLQDALVGMTDMEFLSNEHCFALVANRFRWENCDLGDNGAASIQPVAASEPVEDAAFLPCHSYERVNCGVRFDNVDHVRCKGVNRHDRGRILELLTIEVEPDAVTLVFAGGAAVRLEGHAITCHLQDLGEPWPTTFRPQHPLADSA